MTESAMRPLTRFREKVKDKPHYNRQQEGGIVRHYDMAEDSVLGINEHDWDEVAEQLEIIANKIQVANTEELRANLSHQVMLVSLGIKRYVESKLPY
jgi:hypothetical protein